MPLLLDIARARASVNTYFSASNLIRHSWGLEIENVYKRLSGRNEFFHTVVVVVARSSPDPATRWCNKTNNKKQKARKTKLLEGYTFFSFLSSSLGVATNERPIRGLCWVEKC